MKKEKGKKDNAKDPLSKILLALRAFHNNHIKKKPKKVS